MSQPIPPDVHYDQLLQSTRESLQQLRGISSQITLGRMSVLACWVVLLFMGGTGVLDSAWAWGLSTIVLVGFVLLLFRERWMILDQRRLSRQKRMCETQLDRQARDWKQVPEVDVAAPPEAKELSGDLDLFGHASLYQLVCRAHTHAGRILLRDWMTDPVTAEQVGRRADAVRALVPMVEWRDQLDLRGRLLVGACNGPERLAEWASGPCWLGERRWLMWLSRILTAAFVVCVIGAYSQVAYPNVMIVCSLVVLFCNLLVSVVYCGRIHDIFDGLDSKESDIRQYQDLLASFQHLPTSSARLQQLAETLGGQGGADARRAMDELAKLTRIAKMRHSGLLGVVQLLLQLSILIDFHVLWAVEKWQQRYGAQVRHWLDAIGELEALSSLAALAYENPSWSFPIVSEDAETVQARGLGHPLLAQPVCNDVSLGPSGKFMLVTGSNMSGKSTLLRSLGVNAVLAQAGGPVAAKQLTMPPLRLATSMRVLDSLEDGVSFFMAELKRLKAVVDLAEYTQQNGQRLLFLLDEILQGTNSAERQVAVAQVVRRLTDSHALGAISTHDLELAEHPELQGICQTVHFKESIDAGGRMTFDYQIRDGVATTTNALKLLELVGIRLSAVAS